MNLQIAFLSFLKYEDEVPNNIQAKHFLYLATLDLKTNRCF
jgi:hypothetical protein